MTDCPNCEYHKNRAAMWRAEAYAQAGHDIIERPWVGLTDDGIEALAKKHNGIFYDCDIEFAHAIENKLKEKNS